MPHAALCVYAPKWAVHTRIENFRFRPEGEIRSDKVKCFAQGHKQCDWLGWDSNPHSDNTRT